MTFPKGDVDNLKSSHEGFTFTARDRRLVRELQKFTQELGGLFEGPTDVIALKDFSLNTYINCAAQVVGIYKLELNHCVLRITDGTRIPYSSFRQSGKIDLDSPMSWTDNDLYNATKNHCYEICLFDDHIQILDDLKVGDYITVVNLHVKAMVDNDLMRSIKDALDLEEIEGSQGWAELIVHSGRKYNRGVTITDEDKCLEIKNIKPRIQELINEYQQIAHAITDKAPRPLQDSLTTTDYPLQPFIPIATVKRQSVPNKHRIRGKLIAIKPQSVDDFIVKVCSICDEIFPHNYDIACPNCPNSELAMEYFFELLVEDDSGLLGVEVCGREGEYFMNSITAETLLADKALKENVEMKFETVLDSTHDPRNVKSLAYLPWVELCLFSFKGETNEVMFRVFATSLI